MAELAHHPSGPCTGVVCPRFIATFWGRPGVDVKVALWRLSKGKIHESDLIASPGHGVKKAHVVGVCKRLGLFI